MATAVQETKIPAQPSEAGQPAGKGRFQVHKPGEGYATRLGMFVVAFSFMLYSAQRWYFGWKFLRSFASDWLHLGFMLRWTEDPVAEQAVSLYGALAVAALGLLVAYYYIWVHTRASEFLIKTDGELAKVNWPKVSPWFKASTQVWGATYVVLVVVVALTVYVFGVDFILQFLAHWLFYTD